MTFDRIEAKLATHRECLENLEKIPRSSFDEFASDFRNVQSTLHLFQVGIQTLIDIGGYLVSRLALPMPRKSQDIFESLEERGHLPKGTAVRYAPLVAFRNRVVHLYEEIDKRIVYDILNREREDWRELMDLLLAVLSPPKKERAKKRRKPGRKGKGTSRSR